MSPPPHVYTLTGNLLAERTWEFHAWQAGKTQRAQRESFQVGGKGINVSKMLNRLGAANTALCFSGGATGTECEAWLRDRGFSFVAFSTGRATRSAAVIRSEAQPETTFFSPDVPPSPEALRACAVYLDAQPGGQVLALCGSFPGWADTSFEPLRASLDRWMARGILIADVYGPPLAWAATRPLALVKINATELRSLLPNVSSIAAALAASDFASPVGRWVVSDGPNPVHWRDQAGATGSVQPPQVREVSATGSGDVMLAALVDALFIKQCTLSQALDEALPLAAANAAHPGVAEFPWNFSHPANHELFRSD